MKSNIDFSSILNSKSVYDIRSGIATAADTVINKYISKLHGRATKLWNEKVADEFSRVSIEDLLLDKYFLDLGSDTRMIYPAWIDVILEIYEELEKRDIEIVILKGSIGAGKSFNFSVLEWLQWYKVTCDWNLRKNYYIDKETKIAFISFSRDAAKSRHVTFDKVKSRFMSQFNRDYFPVNPRIKTYLLIPRNNTLLFPGTGEAAGVLGFDVFGGGIDEANSLEVVEFSKKSRGEKYDAGEEMLRELLRRMKSRFMKNGRLHPYSFVTMLGSPKFEDDILNRKIAEFKIEGPKSKIFYKELLIWEMLPEDKFVSEYGEMSKWFIFDTETYQMWTEDWLYSNDGDDNENKKKKKIKSAISDDFIESKINKTERRFARIPMCFWSDFQSKPDDAIRDILNRSKGVMSPLIRRKPEISKIFDYDTPNPFIESDSDFIDNFKCDDRFYRYIHVDLGHTRDAVGIAMCHIPYFVDIGDESSGVKFYPFIKFDFVGRISCDSGNEIIFGDVRNIIYEIEKRGFYINLITYDGFESIDSIQILRDKGFVAGRISVDRTTYLLKVDMSRSDHNFIVKESTSGNYTAPFQMFKEAVYQHRISIPYHQWLEKEIKNAMHIKNKVDHPATGTIDILQAVVASMAEAIVNESSRVYDWKKEDTEDKKIIEEMEIYDDEFRKSVGVYGRNGEVIDNFYDSGVYDINFGE